MAAVCWCDASAKKTVADLYDQFGFDPVDVGPLSEGWRFETGTPAYCIAFNKEWLPKALAEAIRMVPTPKTAVQVGSAATSRALTAPEFQGLAEMLAEIEWFANLDNPRTRRAYRIDVADFMAFVGIQRPEEFRIVTRAHFIARRRDLEGAASPRPPSAASSRRFLRCLPICAIPTP